MTRGYPDASVPQLGFVGVGWIGLQRMHAIARSGVAAVAALCDSSPDALRAASLLAPGATVVRSLAEMLDAELDGVVIATPSALHAAQAVLALERGCAVFCQKPLARNVAETRSVIDAARTANQLLHVDLSYRFTTAMATIAPLVQSGGIGEVFAVDLVFHNAYGPAKPWFYDRALSGGGCVIDLGTHLVDLALWTLGFPAVTAATSRLYASGRLLTRCDTAVEDYAEAQLSLETGAVVRLACSWKVSMGCDAVIRAIFHGSRGSVAMINERGSFYNFVAEQYHGTRREILSEAWEDWPARAALDWASQLARRERYDASVEHVADVAAALDAIYAASVPDEVRHEPHLHSNGSQVALHMAAR